MSGLCLFVSYPAYVPWLILSSFAVCVWFSFFDFLFSFNLSPNSIIICTSFLSSPSICYFKRFIELVNMYKIGLLRLSIIYLEKNIEIIYNIVDKGDKGDGEMKVDYAGVVEICEIISRCCDGRKLNRLSLFEILSCSYDLEFSDICDYVDRAYRDGFVIR